MKATKQNSPIKSQALTLAALLAVILLCLFWRSFLPGFVHFSNDGPLGQQNSSWLQLPAAFTGSWADLNDIGNSPGASPPDLNLLCRWMLGAVGYSKFFPPITLFILGFSAWCFFRQLNFFAIGGGAGRIGRRLEFQLFFYCLLGSGRPAGCFQHGLSRHGIGCIHFFGDTTAHALDTTGFGRVGRGGQCDGGFRHRRHF